MEIQVLDEVATHEVAAVKLKVTVEGETVVVKGHAKKDPADKPNEKIGLLLAYSRALEVASRRLDRRASGLVNHAEDLREKKQMRQAKAGTKILVKSDNEGNVTFTTI